MATVGISVVNYRTAALVVELMDSLYESKPHTLDFMMVVVDNDSQDGSVEVLSEHMESRSYTNWVTIIAAQNNGGFSYGNNIAIRHLQDKACDFFWLLNPDTRVLPGACEALVQCLESTARSGVVGSFLQDSDGTGQIASFHFPSPFGELVNTCSIGFIRRLFPRGVVAAPIPSERQPVDWVAGASMMMTAKVVAQVGLMDEDYFLYFEEVDYCLQVTRHGYTVMFEPASKVVHHVGAATGISDTRKQAPRRPAYWFDSRRRFFQKNYGFVSALFADAMWVLGFLMARTKQVLKREAYIGPPYFLRDFIAQSSWVKGKSARDELGPGLWALIKEDWVANGRDWTKPGFRALAVYRFGVWRMSIRNKWLRAPFSLVYRMLFRRVRNVYGIEFPYSINAGRGIVIEHQGAIVVHGDVQMGDGCIIRQGVTLGNRDLNAPFDAPVLGRKVNIGAGAKILGSVRIGDHATIGANAVVLSDVPKNGVAVGIPAKVVSIKEG